jgi:FkbM family methyltransferase
MSGLQTVRTACAQAVMTRPVVRIVEPLTRRRVRHMGVTIRTDALRFEAWTRVGLFWSLYERHGCLYIRRYLKDSPFVVELGAGLGVSSAHIATGLARGGTLVCVEANPDFLPSIRCNLGPPLRRSGANATVINAAVGVSNGCGVLNLRANPFASYVSRTADPGSIRTTTVHIRSLESIVEEHQPRAFDLVSDIEGAEAQLIMGDDPTGLEHCRRMIIELHESAVDGRRLSPDDLLRALRIRWGFRVLAQNGPVVALVRSRDDLVGAERHR